MRSLSLKLIIILVIVSIAGALFTTLYVNSQTRKAFENYIRKQDQQLLIEELTEYYIKYNTWENVNTVFRKSIYYSTGEDYQTTSQEIVQDHSDKLRYPPFILTSASGVVIDGGIEPAGFLPGEQLPSHILSNGFELIHEETTIGLLVPAPFPEFPSNPQVIFFNAIQKGLLISSAGTIFIALVLGGLLVRSFTHPIRKMVKATEIVAGGTLGYQVEVDSRDEIGKLAAAFNQMSKDLAKIDKSRKQITADIAHDLRTPLSVLTCYADALDEGKIKGNAEMYSSMNRQLKHLNYLIEDLRILSLLDSNELSFHLQKTDPSTILKQTIKAFEPLALLKNIDLILELENNLPQVDLDEERMSQVFGNLLTNSIREIQQGGSILITAKTENEVGNNLAIEIIDNGPGIPTEDLPFIFDRLYKSDKSRQQNHTSRSESGLGLAIAKKMIIAQGGNISVTSEKGKGTTFSISFPVQAEML